MYLKGQGNYDDFFLDHFLKFDKKGPPVPVATHWPAAALQHPKGRIDG
jgi:hypothetical protein